MAFRTLLVLVGAGTLLPVLGLKLPPFDASQDWISSIAARGATVGALVSNKAQGGRSRTPGVDGRRKVHVLGSNSMLPPPNPAPSNSILHQCKGPNSTVSVNEIITQKAWLLAPLVFMHPLEWSQLADPATWLDTVPVYNPDTLKVISYGAPKLNNSAEERYYQNVLGPRMFASQAFPNGFNASEQRISTAAVKERLKGDPIDPRTNYSTAKVWYTAMDAADSTSPTGYARGQAVIIKWHYWYPFSGCSNQLFGMAFRGKQQAIEYYMCAPGVHEGDWEHISMLVSVAEWNETNPSQAITRVQYAQHSWNAQYDCYLGECVFEADDQGLKRLVAYSGLHSHAMFPEASGLQLYQEVSAAFLLNVVGVYIADRSARGGAVFQPTVNNTRYLPLMSNMTTEQQKGEFAWAVFTGSWGGYTFANEKGNQVSITCLFDNYTREGDCPPLNPATSVISYFLGLRRQFVNLNDMVWYNDVAAPYTVVPITGPLMRTYSYEWETENNAPLWKSPVRGVTPACPFSKVIQTDDSGYFEDPPLMEFVVAVALLLVGCGIVFAIALFFPGLSSTGPEVQQLVEHIQSYAPVRTASMDGVMKHLVNQDAVTGTQGEKEKDQLFYGWRALAFMLIGVSSYLAGMVVSALGIAEVFKALSMIYNLDVYEQIRKAFVGVLIIFGTWQVLVLLCVLFIRNERLMKFLCCQPFKNPVAQWHSAARFGSGLQALLAGIHVIAINCTMLLFAFGFFVTMAKMLFQISCNTVLEKIFSFSSTDGQACIDLTPLGIDATLCGAQLTEACRTWAGLHIEWVAYGAVCVALSHLFFLAMSVHQSVVLHSSYQLVNWLRTGRLDSKGALHPTPSKASGDMHMSMDRHVSSSKAALAADAAVVDVRITSPVPDKV